MKMCTILLAGCTHRNGSSVAGGAVPRFDLPDTSGYSLSQTLSGGVYFKTEIYTNRRDTSLNYAKVYSAAGKVAAMQFYKGNKKDGPTILFNDKGKVEQVMTYRMDTLVSMKEFPK